LVNEISLYYDARLKKHQNYINMFLFYDDLVMKELDIIEYIINTQV